MSLPTLRRCYRSYKMGFIVFWFSLIIGCASGEKKTCPSIEEEPISACRAQEKCRRQDQSIGIGVGFGVGPNVGFGLGHTRSSGRYADCIDEDLAEQKKKSATAKPVNHPNVPTSPEGPKPPTD